MGQILGLDMSKTVFFSSTGIRMEQILGLNMSKMVFFSSTGFLILTPDRASYKNW